MTIIFRKSGFKQAELEAVSQATKKWLAGKSSITFCTKPWGARSCLVEGELQKLGLALREQFKAWNEGDRPLHVELL